VGVLAKHSARYIIEGGRTLNGTVRVSGSKNAALPAMAATLLTADEVRLENVPDIEDVGNFGQILSSLGADFSQPDPSTVSLRAASIGKTDAPTEVVVTNRASFLVMGPLLARFGEAACAPPGGDVVGLRPVDVHLAGFRALGAEVGRQGDQLVARADRLRGAKVFLDYPSVLGTQNVMMAAVLAEGHTQIINAASEPEVAALADLLIEMGACIEGAGTQIIEIEGVRDLHGTTHRIIPDRIETGTWTIGAVITNGDVDVIDCVPQHIAALLAKLREAGADVTERGDSIHVRPNGGLRGISVQALPYPGLATDLQAPIGALLTQARGVSFVHERVFDNRLLYVGELRKMGAEVVSAGSTAVITGPTPLFGTTVRALDIRAGAAVVLAGLVAEGRTEILDAYHLDRGYEDLEGKLRRLGADAVRIEPERRVPVEVG
jgi:UDP-N-acetylglucosamine 1-carboxyvinyltransferase